ncbi:MAG TPA: hypothetical protein V6C96_00320 [Vampirovibrionales bacterium]
MIDKGIFWATVESETESGFMPAEVTVDEANTITLTCPKRKSLLINLLQPKRLQEGSVVSFSYFHDNLFELWSAELGEYKSTPNKLLDSYELLNPKLEMPSSGRKEERLLVDIPVTLEERGRKLPRVYRFAGAELSHSGVGLWFPETFKNRIEEGCKYRMILTPKEVAAFAFEVECIRPNFYDSFSKGFTAGFKFTEINEGGLPFKRLGQLLKAKGIPFTPSLNANLGHYLSKLWVSEGLKDF